MPDTYVLFGATGDLAQRKILPALFHLFIQKILPPNFHIVCSSRRDWTDAQYHVFIRPSLNGKETDIEKFLTIVSYEKVIVDDASSYQSLRKFSTREALYHLAVQPEFYTGIIENIGKIGVHGTVMIEKPFGHSESSAHDLEALIQQYLPSVPVLRIDHYLGKKGLNDFLTMRETDALFEARLTASQVKRITVTFAESLDIVDRGAFYDSTGALLDVVQNHCLEMLVVVLLDSTEKDRVAARTHALQKLELLPGTILRAQYIGYREHPEVQKESETETYVSFILTSTDKRFTGIPLHIMAGKALNKKESSIRIDFTDDTSFYWDIDLSGNSAKTPDAYEMILTKAIYGENSFFVGKQEMVALWNITDRVKTAMKSHLLRAYLKGNTIENIDKSNIMA